MFPLYFPQVANEHIKYVLIISYVAGEQLITSMKDQSCIARAASSTVDRSTGEDNIIMF